MIFIESPPSAFNQTERLRNRSIAFALLSILAVCFFIKFRRFGIDDSFIVLRYVDNIIHGRGWTFNPGEDYNASTSVLNTVVITVIALVAGDPLRASTIAGCLAILCSGICLYLLLEERCSAIVATVAAGALMYFLSENGTWGLETNMFIGLILLFVLIEEWKGDSWWILGLIMLARPEGLVLALFKIAREILRDRKAPVRGMIKLAAVCAPWALFSFIRFGQLAPATLRQKLWQGRSGFWGTGHIYVNMLIRAARVDFLEHGRWGLLLMIPLGVGAARVVRERSSLLYFVGFAIVQQIAYIVMNIPGYNWYFAPAEAIGCILVLIGLIHLGSLIHLRLPATLRPALPFVGPATAVIGVVAAVILYQPYLDSPIADPRTTAYTRLAFDITGRISNPSIAAREVGVVGYYSHARMVDLTGLTNREPEFLTKDHMDRFFSIAPDVVIVTDTIDAMEKNVTTDPRFAANYRLANTIVTPRYRTMHYYIRFVDSTP
ncbi:MAG: hypothetical protein JWQ98_105 [Chlorobi bacterium]|nr:hypothetical protein [Chlorobiota bacterium]